MVYSGGSPGRVPDEIKQKVVNHLLNRTDQFMQSPENRTWLRLPTKSGEDAAMVYVRKGQRMGKPSLEISNIEFQQRLRGSGIAGTYLDSLRQKYPDRTLYIEQAQPRWGERLSKEGWQKAPDFGPGNANYYKPPLTSESPTVRTSQTGFRSPDFELGSMSGRQSLKSRMRSGGRGSFGSMSMSASVPTGGSVGASPPVTPPVSSSTSIPNPTPGQSMYSRSNVYSNSAPGQAPSWQQLGQRFVRLRNTSPQVQAGEAALKQAGRTTKGVLGGIGRGASKALPALGAAIDFTSGIALEGEDPIRAAAGAAGSGIGGWGGAAAGAAFGASIGLAGGPLAPVTVPLSAATFGILGGIGGGSIGGYLGDRADEAIRGPGSNPKPNASQKFWTGQTNSQATGYENNSMSSYPPIQGRYGRNQNPLAGGSGSNAVSAQPYGPAMQAPSVQQMQAATPQPQRGSGVDPGLAAGAIGLGAGALGLGAFALSRGRVNPATVAKAAQGVATAAEAAAPAAQAATKAGGFGKIAGQFAPVAIGSLIAAKGIEYAIAQPLLRAVGIAPGAAPPAAGPVAGGPVGGVGGLRYNNPQAPGWVQLLSGGRIQRLPGQQPGFEYTKLETQDATNRRGQDIKQSIEFRGQDVKVYQSDVKAETDRRGQDINLKRTDMQSGRQLEGVKYRADAGIKQAEVTGQYGVKREDVRGQYGNQRETIKGQFGNQRETIKGEYNVKVADLTSGRRLEGTKYTADKRLQGTVYTADKRLEGTVYSSDRKLEGTKYTADKNLQGKDLVSGRALQGVVYSSDRRYQGQVEAATITGNSRIGTADVQGRYRMGTEQVRQEGQARVAEIRGNALVKAAEARAGGGDGGKAEAAIYASGAKLLSDVSKSFSSDQTARRKERSDLAKVYAMSSRR